VGSCGGLMRLLSEQTGFEDRAAHGIGFRAGRVECRSVAARDSRPFNGALIGRWLASRPARTEPGLDIAAADLLEAGLTNHRFEQVDAVVLHRGADDVTHQQVAAESGSGRSEVGDEYPAPGA
jgi:hypothetical protein